jgi:hypothetical protein
MFALLNPRVIAVLIVAAVLAFSHFTVYRWGKNHVRQEWQAAKAAANIEARALEQRRQDRANEAAVLAAKRQSVILADSVRARAAVRGLRDAIESSQRVAEKSQAAATARALALGELLESCSAEYQELGRAADSHSSDVRTLLESWPQ